MTLLGGCCGLVVSVGVVTGLVLWVIQGTVGRRLDEAQERVTRQ
jgi:hypothetical protein